MKTRTPLVVLVVVALTAGSLAACGNSDGETSNAGTGGAKVGLDAMSEAGPGMGTGASGPVAASTDC